MKEISSLHWPKRFQSPKPPSFHELPALCQLQSLLTCLIESFRKVPKFHLSHLRKCRRVMMTQAMISVDGSNFEEINENIIIHSSERINLKFNESCIFLIKCSIKINWKLDE